MIDLILSIPKLVACARGSLSGDGGRLRLTSGDGGRVVGDAGPADQGLGLRLRPERGLHRRRLQLSTGAFGGRHGVLEALALGPF